LDAALDLGVRMTDLRSRDYALRCRFCDAPLFETRLGILLERPPPLSGDADISERFAAAIDYVADHVWLNKQSSENPRGHRPRELWTGGFLADCAFGRVPWFYRESSGVATPIPNFPNPEPVFDPVRAPWHPRISLSEHIARATAAVGPMTRRRTHWRAATAISKRLWERSPASPFSAFGVKDGELVSLARAGSVSNPPMFGWDSFDASYEIRPPDPEFLLKVLAGTAGPLAPSVLRGVMELASIWLAIDSRHEVETYRAGVLDYGSTRAEGGTVHVPSMEDSLVRWELVDVLADAFDLNATSNPATKLRHSASAVVARVLRRTVETIQDSYWGIQRVFR